jgi:hypothetical protein
MSDLSDAIKYLETDAQYLRDNLPNLDDPPTPDQLKLVEPFIGVIQQRLDRLREATARAHGGTAATKRPRRPSTD